MTTEDKTGSPTTVSAEADRFTIAVDGQGMELHNAGLLHATSGRFVAIGAYANDGGLVTNAGDIVAEGAVGALGVGATSAGLVLDNTGSMADDGKMAAMKTAAKNLLTQLKNAASTNGDVYVSIIPFSKDVNIGKSNYTQSHIRWDLWDAANGSGSGFSGSICYNGTLWTVSGDGVLMAVSVRTGLTDGQYTAVSGEGLEEGMVVVAGVTTTATTATSPNPFRQQAPAGGPRPGGF